jgi:hypothetical protein
VEEVEAEAGVRVGRVLLEEGVQVLVFRRVGDDELVDVGVDDHVVQQQHRAGERAAEGGAQVVGEDHLRIEQVPAPPDQRHAVVIRRVVDDQRRIGPSCRW